MVVCCVLLNHPKSIVVGPERGHKYLFDLKFSHCVGWCLPRIWERGSCHKIGRSAHSYPCQVPGKLTVTFMTYGNFATLLYFVSGWLSIFRPFPLHVITQTIKNQNLFRLIIKVPENDTFISCFFGLFYYYTHIQTLQYIHLNLFNHIITNKTIYFYFTSVYFILS